MSNLRVHLDHLIRRQSIRYITTQDKKLEGPSSQSSKYSNEDRALRYEDILRKDGWITNVRKPDFQRETNAWTPKDCVDFIDSVVFGRIIPSIILWNNEENGLVYVLDGAHRLSAIRAWMIDDWGDKSRDYYQRRDFDLILNAANETRTLIREKIGAFSEYKLACSELNELIEREKAPKVEMTETRFRQANFYTRVKSGLLSIYVQWEKGDYYSAEQSFLRINRSGQALDPWEATLIEFRNSSYARCIMSIANGGESGHYWPEPSDEFEDSNKLIETIKTFDERAARIHTRLFVPPLKPPISDLTVPFMVAPAYFQKHKYLLEILPLITERKIAIQEEKQIELMKLDVDSQAQKIIKNTDNILAKLENNLDHFISETHNSKSLSIVPLFYWYNQNGKFIRALFYGFLYWMLAGNDDDIKNRKIVFSANRDRFETLLFDLKNEIAPSLQLKSGAGLKATSKISSFFHSMLDILNHNQKLKYDQIEEKIIELLSDTGLQYKSKNKLKKSRAYSKQDKSSINIRELFDSSIRCHVCGGIVNLKQSLQYDHSKDFAVYRVTDPDTGKPTHPFCNNFKQVILQARSNNTALHLPSLQVSIEKDEQIDSQLSFWGNDDEFPE